MKKKENNIKFKKVSENEIVVSAKNKKDAMNKARELFNSDLKDIDINNISYHLDFCLHVILFHQYGM